MTYETILLGRPAPGVAMITLNRPDRGNGVVPEMARDLLAALEALEADAIEDHRKTQSQRLRAVLFLNWKYDSKGYKTFAMYYDSEMERIIEHFKKKLP